MITLDALDVLTVLGGISLLLHGLQLAVALFPRLLNVRSRLWRHVSDLLELQAFRKRAAAAGVEDVVNRTAFNLHRHFPKGWIRRARIRWVKATTASDHLEDKIVLRVRPRKGLDRSLVYALRSYFSTVLFPQNRDLLPKNLRSALALAATRVSLEQSHPYLLEEFDRQLIDGSTEDLGGEEESAAVLNAFADLVRLNHFGFLLGPFIRELDSSASAARFAGGREVLGTSIENIINHMLSFQALVPNMPEEDWYHKDACSSYGFLLVSKPPEIRPAIEAYVNRAKERVGLGIKRLYVIGRKDERDFVYRVVRAIPAVRELRLEETFPLLHDYRGDPEGIGALLAIDDMLAELDLRVRHVPAALVAGQTQELSAGQPGTLGEEEDEDFHGFVVGLIAQLSDYEGAWVHLADVGHVLRQRMPEFTPQNYGGRNLFSVLENLSGLEFDKRGLGPAKSVYVRLTESKLKGLYEAEDLDRSRPSESEIRMHVISILNDNRRVADWMFLGTLGDRLRSEYGRINYSDYGAGSLSKFLEEDRRLEFTERGEGNIYVRVRE